MLLKEPFKHGSAFESADRVIKVVCFVGEAYNRLNSFVDSTEGNYFYTKSTFGVEESEISWILDNCIITFQLIVFPSCNSSTQPKAGFEGKAE
ncbi:unnamed protein product [Citrullus colocynthis]|uniref:Uncharacterized protein n=1 Tax=Citrullus colocynthis TaxID=252529 RepID=A0ABP0Z1D6_9ROSI